MSQGNIVGINKNHVPQTDYQTIILSGKYNPAE